MTIAITPFETALRTELLRVFKTVIGVDPACVFDMFVPLEKIPSMPAILFKVSGQKRWDRSQTYTNQYKALVAIDMVVFVNADGNVLSDAKNSALMAGVYAALNYDLTAGTAKTNIYNATNPGSEANVQHIWPDSDTGFSIYPDKTGLGFCRMKWTAEILHNQNMI